MAHLKKHRPNGHRVWRAIIAAAVLTACTPETNTEHFSTQQPNRALGAKTNAIEDSASLAMEDIEHKQRATSDWLGNPSPRHIQSHPGVAKLKSAHPGANVRVSNNRIRRVYGQIAKGKTPREAAEAFRENGMAAFDLSPDDVVPTKPGSAKSGAQLNAKSSTPNTITTADDDGLGLMYDPATDKYRFRLYTYRQQQDGVPVYGAGMRTLVREDSNTVVWANTNLKPMDNFKGDVKLKSRSVDTSQSLAALRNHLKSKGKSLSLPRALKYSGTPTPTIFAGFGDNVTAPTMALEYIAQDTDSPRNWTFVADAKTGEVLHIKSNTHQNIDGSVLAEVTPGLNAIGCGVGFDTVPLPYAAVTSDAGDAFTDDSGAFTIVESGSGSLDITSALTGEYVDVIDKSAASDPVSMTLNVTPPTLADFLHQAPGEVNEKKMAQLNAYVHVNAIRDFLLSYIPEYPVISEQRHFPVNVNNYDSNPDGMFTPCKDSGGGWYDAGGAAASASITLCQRSATHANTAFGSILHHEYAHHIIQAGGSEQLEYGEGMADAIAILYSKDSNLGYGYGFDCNVPIRDGDSDCNYSETGCSDCGNGYYDCGSVISGIVWDIWQNLIDSDDVNPDNTIAELVLNSVLLHMTPHIEPSLVIDFLTLDDDDGILENGTPHYTEICNGFSDHGMSCPPIPTGLIVGGEQLDARGPSAGPFTPDSVTYTLFNAGPAPNITWSASVPASASWLNISSTGGNIPLGDKTTVTVSINQSVAAQLPDGQYSEVISFVNETSGVGNRVVEAKLWTGATMPVFTATFDNGLDGFTTAADSSNLWHHSTVCMDPLPGHSSPGSLYFGIDSACNFNNGAFEMYTITSPEIEIPVSHDAVLGMNYFLRTIEDDNNYYADVRVSVDGGPFQIVASNNRGGVTLAETPRWQTIGIPISDLLPTMGPTTIQVQLGFEPSNPYDNFETGFVVDDVIVYAHNDDQPNQVTIPARIEAEYYQRAWDSTQGNTGGDCDTGDNVDKEFTGDPAGGGCNVGWITAGEWLEYDVYVAETNDFNITVRAAAEYTGRSFRIEVDGVDRTGAVTVPANGWHDYSNVKVWNINMSAGTHVVRLYMLTDYMNINFLKFELSNSPHYCGNGICELDNEYCQLCPEDCGECPVYCPDGICQRWEGCNTCPADCGQCPGAFCGDSTCDPTENCNNCEADCGACPEACTCPQGCDAVVSANTPFVRDGADNTCYFFNGSAGNYINSWETQQVNLNGTDITNFWIGAQNYPGLVDGGYYLYNHSVNAWSHVEVQ